MKTKKKKHYVNNKDFLQALIEYKEEVNKALENDLPRPRVSNYVGDCIMKIAVHLSHKPNFVNYSFKEEMICDGIENCLQYIDNFNPEKSTNPFAYFTQIIFFAFLRRIAKEKKHLYTKLKLTEELNVLHMTSDVDAHNSDSVYDTAIKYNEWTEDYVSNFIRDFEETKRKNREKKGA